MFLMYVWLCVTNLNHSRSALTRTPKFYNVNFKVFTFIIYGFLVTLPPELAALQLISACGGIRSLFSKVVLGFRFPRCRT